jgi:GT2 family glycosyltransferase
MRDRMVDLSSTAGPPPRVSVVVMTFNRPASLRRCLASLAAQTLPCPAFEVVVVDVSEPTVEGVLAEFAGRLRLTHHVGRNLGVAGNRNTGVARSRAPVVAFLDDDCVASAAWLERITARVESEPHCLVGGQVEHPAPRNAYAAAGQVITEAVHAFFNPPGQAPRFVPGLNFALERERYLAIGGCDPLFGRLAAEDRDLVDRWCLAGGRLALCPEATVRHEHRDTLRGFVRQYFNYGRGAWRYHSLRRSRRCGSMAADIRLHLRLPRYVGEPLGRLPRRMRARAVLLLGVWQLANLAGFAWQAALDGRVAPRDPDPLSA